MPVFSERHSYMGRNRHILKKQYQVSAGIVEVWVYLVRLFMDLSGGGEWLILLGSVGGYP